MHREAKLVALFASIAALAFSPITRSETKTIRLTCEYSWVIDAGGPRETSGTALLTIRYSATGEATIKSSGLGAEYKGTISEEEIFGEVTWENAPSDSRLPSLVYEWIRVNRFTGEFTRSFSPLDDKGSPLDDKGPLKGPLLFSGKCRATPEKLF